MANSTADTATVPRMLQRYMEQMPSPSLRFSRGACDSGAESALACCPLTRNDIHAELCDDVATITFTQQYRNASNVTVATEFCFPVMPNMAVCALVVTTPDGTVAAKVEEKRAASAAFREAQARGDAAFMATYDEEQLDMLKLQVGSLREGECITVRIVVSTLLMLPAAVDPLSPRWELVLPLAYVSPYVSRKEVLRLGGRSSSSLPAMLQQPQLPTVPYQWSFTAQVTCTNTPSRCERRVARLESLTYPAEVTVKSSTEQVLRLSICSDTPPSDMIHIAVTQSQTHSAPEDVAFAALYADPQFPQHAALLLRFNPSCIPPPPPEPTTHATCAGVPSAAAPALDVTPASFEYVLILDRSGSMNGSSITIAVRAVQTWLTLLPQGALFNVVSFGTNHEVLFRGGSVAVSKDNIATASSEVAKMQANLGGTEILGPLAFVLQSPCTAKRFRNVFLVTDGAVSNELSVVNVIAQHSHCNRLFTFGIGAGASPLLVLAGARAGHGQSYFLHSGERSNYLDEALADSMTLAGRLSYYGLSVDLSSGFTDFGASSSVEQPIHAGRTGTHLRLLERTANHTTTTPTLPSVVFHVREAFTNRPFTLNVSHVATVHGSPTAISAMKLAAKETLQALEEALRCPRDAIVGFRADDAERRMISISCLFNILCSKTALLAIQERKDGEKKSPEATAVVPAAQPKPYVDRSTQHCLSACAVLNQQQCLMMANIDQVLCRSVTLDSVVLRAQTELLCAKSCQFQRSAGILRTSRCCKIIVTVLLTVIAIVLIVCLTVFRHKL